MCWWQSDLFVRLLREIHRRVLLTRVDLQEFEQLSIDWNTFIDDWAIDGAHFLVSRRVGGFSNLLDVRSPAIGCFRRSLSDNQVSGTIPSTIGQLTALTFL
jgi:hypothetical protein